MYHQMSMQNLAVSCQVWGGAMTPLPLQVDRKPTWFFGRIQGANEDGTFEVRLTLALTLALTPTLT